MHPTIYQQLAQDKIAELHRQTGHERPARAARQERRARRHHPQQRLPLLRGALTRQALAVLGIRNP